MKKKRAMEMVCKSIVFILVGSGVKNQYSSNRERAVMFSSRMIPTMEYTHEIVKEKEVFHAETGLTKPIDVPSNLPPDYVRCFEQVKSLLNSTMNNALFCEAPCV